MKYTVGSIRHGTAIRKLGRTPVTPHIPHKYLIFH
jgi:hypothetical protein